MFNCSLDQEKQAVKTPAIMLEETQGKLEIKREDIAKENRGA
jgi:hypothetical protein